MDRFSGCPWAPTAPVPGPPSASLLRAEQVPRQPVIPWTWCQTERPTAWGKRCTSRPHWAVSTLLARSAPSRKAVDAVGGRSLLRGPASQHLGRMAPRPALWGRLCLGMPGPGPLPQPTRACTRLRGQSGGAKPGHCPQRDHTTSSSYRARHVSPVSEILPREQAGWAERVLLASSPQGSQRGRGRRGTCGRPWVPAVR